MKRAQNYTGIPYAQADCAALTELVQREVFGRHICLPGIPAHPAKQMQALRQHRSGYASRVLQPATGDGVLMYEVAGECRQWHMGTAFAEEELWVLHTNVVMGAVLTRVSELPMHGLRLEGFYAWK